MFEVSARITPVQHIAVEAIFEQWGAVSISLSGAENNPVLIKQLGSTPLWNQINISAQFLDDIDTQKLHTEIESVLSCSVELFTNPIQEQDWEHSYQHHFPPLQFGERLWVCPSWHTPPDPFAINIRLDPGLAFGTGTHPTTELCLKCLAQQPPKQSDVIDFGCGSGILAIAAYYLGAKNVLAIDYDAQAITATRQNAALNFVPEHSFTISHAEELQNHSCDVLIANILLQPLLELKTQFANALRPAGTLLLSGILDTQFDELRQAYAEQFTIRETYARNEWFLVEAVQK